MITPAYLKRMARYNRWQNDSIYTAANTLPNLERRRDRGAFFGSIHATLSHVLWADQLWMSRLSDWATPEGGIPGSHALYDDWGALRVERQTADLQFIAWAETVKEADIGSDLVYTNTSGVRNTLPRPLCLIQVFNHQTHHRGQVHAMLTAAGAQPEDTDLQVMPEAYL